MVERSHWPITHPHAKVRGAHTYEQLHKRSQTHTHTHTHTHTQNPIHLLSGLLTPKPFISRQEKWKIVPLHSCTHQPSTHPFTFLLPHILFKLSLFSSLLFSSLRCSFFLFSSSLLSLVLFFLLHRRQRKRIWIIYGLFHQNRQRGRKA